MTPTIADWSYWQARARRPSWASHLKIPERGQSVGQALDHAINHRSGYPKLPMHRRESVIEKSNACNILKTVRKREALSVYMAREAYNLRGIQPRRAATYLRWLRRLRPDWQ